MFSSCVPPSSLAAAQLRDEHVTLERSSGSIRLSDINQPPVFAHVLPLRGSLQRSWIAHDAVAAVFVTTPLKETSLAAAMGRAAGGGESGSRDPQGTNA